MFNGAAADFTQAEGGWLLALVRGLSIAVLFTGYGARLFRCLLLLVWLVIQAMADLGTPFCFAAVNRWRWTPALATSSGAGGSGGRKAATGRGFRRSVLGETLLGLLAAGVLTNLAPSMHLQPVWPFTEQPSLVTVREDPDFRAELLRAAAVFGFGLILLAAGALAWLWGGGDWAAMAAGLGLAAWALPHFGLLFIDAYPTSFYRSPTNFAAASIAEGETLFPANCACHGAEGRGGDGGAGRHRHPRRRQRLAARGRAAGTGRDRLGRQPPAGLRWKAWICRSGQARSSSSAESPKGAK